MNYTLNVKGRLMDLAEPKVMGILNATPDSFYSASRMQTEEAMAERANRIVQEGAHIIDVGACSTRPGSEPVSQEEEMRRLRVALDVVRRELPYSVVSVDTFRPDVARMAVEEFGADIVNDVSGGTPEMFRMAARLDVPYVLTSTEPDLRQSLLSLAIKVQQLRDFGQKDIVIDPGFGFGKPQGDDGSDANFALMARLEQLSVLELPLLVGISRKSMIYRLLGITPADALNGTTALNMVALMKGASLLRVHDVKEAVECVKLFGALRTGSEVTLRTGNEVV